MAQKKKIRAGRKSTRQVVHQKKARRTKVMTLSARDAVKRLPVKSTVRSNQPIKAQHSETPSRRKAATPVENIVSAERQGAVEPAPIIAEENTSPSIFASQLQLFTTLIKWSPLGIVIRQQTLVADMMFNMHYPKDRKAPR